MKVVSINQPAYLPWLGYFQRIAVSDVHIMLDHVQFEKNSFTNRNKIRTREGWQWLSIPLKTKGKFGSLEINTIETDNLQPWAKKHWAALCQNYSKAPFFGMYAPFFEQLYKREWTRLNDLLAEMTSYLLMALGITTPVRRSSEMEPRGHKDELVLDLCCKLGASHYLSGALGRNYLREEIFTAANIRVSYQNYRHPEYSQLYSGFEPDMAVIDLLFNHGPESLTILTKDQEKLEL